MTRLLYYLLAIGLGSLLLACGSGEQNGYIPKPKGYNRIWLPPQNYQLLAEEHPYSFEYSTSAVILPDTYALAEKHWIYLYYPRFNANIQLTYKSVQNNPARLKGFIDDAYRLAGKHHIRASSVQEQIFRTESGQTATLFKLEGDVPSPLQFYTTDSTTHYLRGAIYFPTATKNDSLAPVIRFIEQDALRLLNTLKWK
jgi:gliding motility-associated lipoprotein GldD